MIGTDYDEAKGGGTVFTLNPTTRVWDTLGTGRGKALAVSSTTVQVANHQNAVWQTNR